MNGQRLCLARQDAGNAASHFPCRGLIGLSSPGRVTAFDMVFMSYYRDKYLKSEDWKTLRDSKVARCGNICALCQKEQSSVDVHHLKYKHLYDVTHDDLRVLCRDCHNKIHALLLKYPKMKTLGRKRLWQTIKCHLGTKRDMAYFRFIVARYEQKKLKRILRLKKWNDKRASRSLPPIEFR